VDVPFAIARFITKKPGCVLVTFSAPVKSDGNYVSVQIVMNSLTCLPSTETPNIFAVSDRFDVYANSMTYICPDVPISKKVLKAQWKFAHTGGDSAYLYGFTMTVAHR